MPKISFAGFKDPVRRPRYFVWTGVLVLVVVAFMITALGVTSTYWFCAEACHKVQDDTIIAFDAGSHSEISCMACHMPVGAGPVTFVLHKMEALGEAYLTISNKYELPLNGTSHLALSVHMPEEQCTQCHNLENRNITPSDGIIIDHAIHAENEVACSWCHNRVAHPEDFDLTLTNPDGEPNTKHDDFMEMTACFRCHGLEDDAQAPGACSKCHPSDFDLKPPSHDENDFYPSGHAQMALEDMGLGHAEEDAHVEEVSDEAHSEEATEGEEHAEEEAAEDHGEADEGHGDAHGGEGWEPGLEGTSMIAVSSVGYCGTCHVVDEFCNACHGMEMPHPEAFKTEQHPEAVQTQYDKCVLCHAPEETQFCDECHHGTAVAWDFDNAEPWSTQHAKNVSDSGVAQCLEACHEQQYCLDCHTAQNPFPTSHKAGDWLHRASFDERAGHSETAKMEVTGCEVCHGEGGVEAAFCKGCHVFEMPHEDEFKERHAATGRANEAQCSMCHKFGAVCSTCHHNGITAPWQTAHPQTVAEEGAAGCLETCHADKQFCVDCHNTLQALPSSHTAADWTYRASDEGAKHWASYNEQADSCTYCHGDGGPTSSFCMNCHGLEMPHPGDFGTQDDGGVHQAGLADGTLARADCDTCHKPVLCNSCHHNESTPERAWRTHHDEIVKEAGADGCFDCHEPTYCAYCHVRELAGEER